MSLEMRGLGDSLTWKVVLSCRFKGNEANLIKEAQFFKQPPDSSSLLAFAKGLDRKIERKTFFLEGGTAASNLLILLDDENAETFLS